MPRREWGSGAFFQRKDGRWVGSIEAHDARPGRHRIYVTGSDPKVVKRKLTRLSRSSRSSQATGETVAAFLDRWLKDGAREVRPRTVAGYRTIIDRHLSPYIGGATVAGLTAMDVQALVSNRLDAGLSPRTVGHVLACLRTALAFALRQGTVDRNVAVAVRAPHTPTQEVRPLSLDDVARFLDHVRGDRLEALYVLAFTTGMRQGELLGLRWQDIDVRRRELHVNVALVRIGGKYVLAEPKTRRSRRTLPLTDMAVDALETHRRRQMAERTSSKRLEQGLVFTGPLGSPLDASRVTEAFQGHLRAAGLRRQRFHDTRHAAASLMVAQGMTMRAIADMLGHSTPSLTANVYSHLGDETLRDGVRLMDDAFRNRVG